MAVIVASSIAETVAANTKTADLVSGQYQNVQKGKLTLVALPSAAGVLATLSIGGITLINDLPVGWFGASGTMDLSAHVVLSQEVLGGKIELYFRDTSGAGKTCDFQLMFEPA